MMLPEYSNANIDFPIKKKNVLFQTTNYCTERKKILLTKKEMLQVLFSPAQFLLQVSEQLTPNVW